MPAHGFQVKTKVLPPELEQGIPASLQALSCTELQPCAPGLKQCIARKGEDDQNKLGMEHGEPWEAPNFPFL